MANAPSLAPIRDELLELRVGVADAAHATRGETRAGAVRALAKLDRALEALDRGGLRRDDLLAARIAATEALDDARATR